MLLLTLGFMQVGLDIITSTNCESKLWSGLDKQHSTLVLKFNFIIPISRRISNSQPAKSPER
jgi:hypothetical protein